MMLSSLSYLYTLHPGAQAGAAVQCKQGALQLAGAVHRPVSARQTTQEKLHRLLRPDTQHRFRRPGHAQVGDIARALGIDPLVGGGDVVHYISDVLAGLAFGSGFALVGWQVYLLAARALLG